MDRDEVGTMQETIAVFRALGDETRARILLALHRHPLYVCQIVELVGTATSTVSEHLMVLKQVGLVATRREGRWVRYHLVDEPSSRAARQALAALLESMSRDTVVRQDAERIRHILHTDPEELCRLQRVAGGKCCWRRDAAAKLGTGGLSEETQEKTCRFVRRGFPGKSD